MKKVILGIVAVVLLAGSVHADYLVDPKWSQKPDETEFGYDFSSETLVPSIVADDFLCNDPLAITDIHWWGSYWTHMPLDKNSDHHGDPSFPAPGAPPVMPSVVTAFTFTFWTDVPALADPNMPHSHPGAQLYSMTIPIANIATNLHGTIDRDNNGIVGDNGDEAIWQYNVDLPRPFEQLPGTIYWLGIQAVNDGAANPNLVQWGWHESVDHNLDNAVQDGPGTWGPDYDNQQWVNLSPKDMAFELSVPEPATMALLGSGMVWMAMAGRRKRKADK